MAQKCFKRFRRTITQQRAQPPQIPISPYATLEDSTWDDVDGAWKHIVTSSGPDERRTTETYTDAIKAVEHQARAIYTDDPLAPIPQTDEFVRIMIQSGCFVLQVALLSLGAEDPIFDKLRDKQRIEHWLTSLFDIKNQVPLVVLKELMKQSFFNRVLESVECRRMRFNDLQRRTLFELLVAPMLESRASKLSDFARLFKSHVLYQQDEPPTLLHALWLRFTGPDDYRDDEEEDDEELNTSAWPVVRCAMELQQVGIRFRTNKGMGTRSVSFERRMFDAVLGLPFIRIFECETEILFKNLIEYENEVFTDRNKRQVCAYLQLMRELVCTADDANVLALSEIILADPKQEEDLPEMLRRLPLQEVGNCHNLVRRQIRAYVKPSKWVKLKNLVSLAVVLTLIQTVYSVLSFHFGK